MITLDADGILCLGVRFNLIDVIKKGNSYREEIKLSTTNTSTKVEQTVSSILGSRFLSGMTRISIDLTDALDRNNKWSQDTSQWKVEGLVSKAPSLTARDGSVARESQFFSINGRPVELPKVSRTIGDAWRAFEGTKKRPACVLCFTLPNNEYDVNLSPDKREVLLTHQDAICSLIHEQVTKLWSSQNDGNFVENSVQVVEKPSVQPAPVVSTTVATSSEGDASSPESSPGKRRRFRRRNAFVHDFGMARLQHEEDEHERVQCLQQQVTASTVSPADQDVSNKTETTTVSLIERQSTPAAGVPQDTAPAGIVEQTTATHADGPSPLPTSQRSGPSNEERRQWASIQSRFNKDSRHGQDDEIQALQQAEKQPAIAATSGLPISPEEPPLMQQGKASRRRAAMPTEQPESATPAKRTRTFTLEDFAFRPASKMTKPSTEVAALETRKAATVASKPITAEEEMESRKRFGVSSSADRQQREDRRKRQKASEPAVAASYQGAPEDLTESDSAQATPPVEPEKTLVWNSFDGADAVMKATKDARFSMRSFRKELRAIAKSPHTVGENDAMVGGIETDGSAEATTDASQADDRNTSNNNVVSLSKEDFRHFQVIGQFNLGFILAKCRNNHLWILDQHACDEKYNFERLCATTVMHEQKLIAPMPLELSPSEESCILENMQVFEENGFRFAHDPDKPPRHRLSLTALPHSGAQDGRKAVQFGKEDVHALCAMLTAEEGYSQDGGTGVDGSGMYGNNAVRRHAGVSQTQDSASKIIARLPKAIAMFANRACRGSIMIGTALSQKEMEAIVKRLADVDNPWSCPHGRPTMRHVKDLTEIMLEDEQRAASLVAGPTMAVMTQMTQNDEPPSQQDEAES